MMLMKRHGDKVHKKILQFLNSKSAPTVSDPVCRFIEYMFNRATPLEFEVDKKASIKLAISKRKPSLSAKRPSVLMSTAPLGTNLGETNEDAQNLPLGELPFAKQLKFINIKDCPYSSFKGQLIQEGILN